jgi:hypothetical protein
MVPRNQEQYVTFREVDRLGRTHGLRHGHAGIVHRPSAILAHLVDAAVHLAFGTERPVDQRRVSSIWEGAAPLGAVGRLAQDQKGEPRAERQRRLQLHLIEHEIELVAYGSQGPLTIP